MPESNVLSVFYENREVGKITADGMNRMSFRYSASWVNDPDAFRISISMPLRDEAFPPETAHSFFANLLPEGLLRMNTARSLGVSADNDLELLARIGGECAGALWIGDGEPRT